MQGRDHEPAEPSSPGPARCPGSAAPVRGKSWALLVTRLRTRLRSPADPQLSLCPSYPRQQQSHPFSHPGSRGMLLAAPRTHRSRTHCPALTAPHSPLPALTVPHSPSPHSLPRTHRAPHSPSRERGPRCRRLPAASASRREGPEQRRARVRVRLGRGAGASERRPRRRPPPALPPRRGRSRSLQQQTPGVRRDAQRAAGRACQGRGGKNQ